MATEKRVRLNPEARRAQLIELGVEMLATRTLDELSVEDIAQQAGISRGLLFHYFSSKQEFHLEVARAAAQELLNRTERDDALAPLDALHASTHSFIDYIEENPDSYKSLVRGAVSGDAEMRALYAETRATLAQRVVDTTKDIKPRLSYERSGAGRTDVIVSYTYGKRLKNWLAIDDSAYGASMFGREFGELTHHFLLLDSARGISDDSALQRIRQWLIEVLGGENT